MLDCLKFGIVENSQWRNFEKNWLTIHTGMKDNATQRSDILPLIIAANQKDNDLNLRHTNNNLRHPKFLNHQTKSSPGVGKTFRCAWTPKHITFEKDCCPASGANRFRSLRTCFKNVLWRIWTWLRLPAAVFQNSF